jgi:hypothetical protein
VYVSENILIPSSCSLLDRVEVCSIKK